ncbi:MAG: DUF3108 domain-containing protein, partial [Rubrivivax sp.]
MAVGVVALHLLLAWLWPDRPPRGGVAPPAPLTVRFVHVLQPTAPPAWWPSDVPLPTPPLPPSPRAPRWAPPVIEVADAAAASASAPLSSEAPEAEGERHAAAAATVPAVPEVPDVPDVPDVADEAGGSPAARAASPAPAASTPVEPAFEWPPSTRLRYALTGNYRGSVEGQAEVQWLRDGKRYEVRLDVVIGPSFLPAITRRMRSVGEVGADGLRPQHFEERTRLFFGSSRDAVVRFDDARVMLPGGRSVPRPPGVQDAVSQFVQLTWRFTREPALLQAGQRVVVPLALPRRVEPWVYEVQGVETLYTPAGPVDAVHVKPRRMAPLAGELVPEMWFAPSLQYLPVRILIRQDAETFVDLLVDR